MADSIKKAFNLVEKDFQDKLNRIEAKVEVLASNFEENLKELRKELNNLKNNKKENFLMSKMNKIVDRLADNE